MSYVEVITSVQKRRQWTPEEKRLMVEEAESPGMSVSTVARNYGIHPKSNVIAESFVKTFKQDYVYMNHLHDTETVLKMIPEWFQDYTNIIPIRA